MMTMFIRLMIHHRLQVILMCQVQKDSDTFYCWLAALHKLMRTKVKSSTNAILLTSDQSFCGGTDELTLLSHKFIGC